MKFLPRSSHRLLSLLLALVTGATGARAEADALSSAHLCKAAIAVMNGISPSSMTAKATSTTQATVRYTRDDGRPFEYGCLIEDSEIRWRQLPDMPAWSKNVRLRYQLATDGNTVKVTVLYSGDEGDSRVFARGDLN